MRIAQLAPLAESVPPPGYGGSELVVSLLTEELVKRGHEVTLFASGDSATDAELISCAPTGLRQNADIPETRWAAYDLKSLLVLGRMADRFDIIHNHMGFIALPFLRGIKCPSVTTNHNRVSDYCADIFLEYKEQPIVAISESYRKLNYQEQLNYVATVHNGVDTDTFSFDEKEKQTHLLFLGRLCPEKGTVEAIRIARQLGLPIVLAGKIDKRDGKYFEEQVLPLLNEPEVEFVGEVNCEEKGRLYRSAIATLCPVRFEEPFGLVLAESLASGTPVMAFRRGAIPEVVSDGETGIVGDTIADLVNRFGEIEKMSRAACRERATRLFSKERMTEQYEQVYLQLQSKALASQRL